MKLKPAVAIIHYHLRPGGVTRVIERAVESLKGRVKVVVLAGEPPEPDSPLAPLTCVCPALGYSEHPHPEPTRILADLIQQATDHLKQNPDIWHIHNHSLGKNSLLPQLVHLLAEQHQRMMLQPHDFAEDGRPENYRLLSAHLGEQLEKMLYPTSNRIFYTPINFRDKKFLEDAGLKQVYELPNAVTPFNLPEKPRAEKKGRTFVYPARAIRRKNMGEFLLWSLLAPNSDRFISTLAPQNPAVRPIYENWVAFAQELELPVVFDAGRTRPFDELIFDADALITTSIAEGFGLAFLEPWLEAKPLIGRDLPEITADFKAQGLDLSPLYSQLPIPLDWIGADEFSAALEKTMRNNYEAYGIEWNPNLLKEARSALIQNSCVDFGILNEPMQQHIIRHLHQHPADQAHFPNFESLLQKPDMENNGRIAATQYSPIAYGDRLYTLYQRLLAAPPSPTTYMPSTMLLKAFLHPARFNLLRT